MSAQATSLLRHLRPAALTLPMWTWTQQLLWHVRTFFSTDNPRSKIFWKRWLPWRCPFGIPVRRNLNGAAVNSVATWVCNLIKIKQVSTTSVTRANCSCGVHPSLGERKVFQCWCSVPFPMGVFDKLSKPMQVEYQSLKQSLRRGSN